MRPTPLQVLMTTAQAYSTRSTCSRLHVGCVVAKDNRVISTGYNGAPSGVEHCNHDCDCPGTRPLMTDGVVIGGRGVCRGNCNSRQPCTLSVHAEANAICFAAKHGMSLERATVYTTHAPCFNCSLLLISAGISRVYFQESYRDMSGIDFLVRNEINVFKFTPESKDDMIERWT